VGRQVAWDVIGSEVGAQANQVFGSGILLAQALQRHGPGGGDGLLGGRRPTQREQLPCPTAEQVEVIADADGGLVEVSSRLLQRQRQIPQFCGEGLECGVSTARAAV
jgi:hypothetical protein